jgi:hypothetical protein
MHLSYQLEVVLDDLVDPNGLKDHELIARGGT